MCSRGSFSLFVALSLAAHLALFGLAAVFGPKEAAPPSPAAALEKDFQAFRDALRDYASSGAVPERLAKAMIELSEQELDKAFRKAPALDYRLSDREKMGLYKSMTAEALANFAKASGERADLDDPLGRSFGSLGELPRTDPGADFDLVKAGETLDESARLFMISKETARQLEALISASPKAGGHKDPVLVQDETGLASSVPGEYFYRDSPYLQITAVGARMFYAVKGFPELPALEPVPGAKASAKPGVPEPPPAFSVIYISRARPRTNSVLSPSTGQPLVLGPGEAERILDGLMTLPGDEQVRRFYHDYLSRYDPDSRDLAELTSAFIYGNLGMMFVGMDNPLSRGFDLLEEVYYDNLSQDELVLFALANPRSRTGTAILLGLAASYEFERRALAALDGSLAAAKRVLADPAADTYPVHNKDVKAYVLREVYRDLAAELRRRHYGSMASVLEKYRDKQLEIYDYLVRMGGAARSQALYALGRLYWDEGDPDLAMTMWRSVDPVIAKGTASDVRQALTGMYPVRMIDYILEREGASDKARLFDRLQRFHKWANR
jgi:hypothetical protein